MWEARQGEELTPDERAYRESKSKLDPIWHNELASVAESNGNWFAAAFHRAWELKADPSSPTAYYGLQDAYSELRDESPNLVRQLPEVVESSRTLSAPEITAVFARKVNNAMWKKVSLAEEEPPSDTQLARMADVCDQFPRGNYSNTLGVAQYRAGRIAEAVDALGKSLTKSPEVFNIPGPHPIDLAFLAMSHFKLGNMEQAKQFFDQLRLLMSRNRYKENEEAIRFSAEARELFGHARTSCEFLRIQLIRVLQRIRRRLPLPTKGFSNGLEGALLVGQVSGDGFRGTWYEQTAFPADYSFMTPSLNNPGLLTSGNRIAARPSTEGFVGARIDLAERLVGPEHKTLYMSFLMRAGRCDW